jgi:tRNA dimethylallyltransferase
MSGEAGARPRVLAIVGPTACGKSAVALGVAQAIGGEIVVADPFQRYRGLEVAADSPRPADLAAAAHHCVGDLGLDERSTAAGFAEAAHRAIDDIIRRGAVPVVSGGTGLYVRAALADLSFAPEPGDEERREVERLVREDHRAALARLRARDPALAGRVDARNPRRLARALAAAMAGAAGLGPPGELWSAETRHPTLVVALERERGDLDRRIAARVERELAEGLVGELEAALARADLAREPAQIIGMREVAALRAGAVGRDDLPALLAGRTRRLARRQLAWLRKTPGLARVPLAPGEEAPVGIRRVLELWERASSR